MCQLANAEKGKGQKEKVKKSAEISAICGRKKIVSVNQPSYSW